MAELIRKDLLGRTIVKAVYRSRPVNKESADFGLPKLDFLSWRPTVGPENDETETRMTQIRESVAGLIPFNSVHQSWVVCSICGMALRSQIPVAELEGKAPVELVDTGVID